MKKLKKISIKLSSKLRLNRIKLLKLLIRKYLKINNLILLILFLLLSRSIYNFIDERDYPFNKTISVGSMKPELSIVICVSLYHIKGDRYNIHNKSLSELER